MNRVKVGHDTVSLLQNQHLVNGSKLDHHLHPPINPHIASIDWKPSSISSSDGDSSDNIDFSNAVLKYVNNTLMEDEALMLQNFSALQAAEKSFYDVLGQEYPSSLNESPCLDPKINEPDGSLTCRSRGDSGSSTRVTNLGECIWIFDQVEFNSSCIQNSVIDPFEDTNQVANLYSESILNGTLVVSKPPEEDTRDYSFNDSREKAHHLWRGSSYAEGRSKMHCAISKEEPEESGMLDKILICQAAKGESATLVIENGSQNGASRPLKQNKQIEASEVEQDDQRKRVTKRKLGTCGISYFNVKKLLLPMIGDNKGANEANEATNFSSSDGNQRLAH